MMNIKQVVMNALKNNSNPIFSNLIQMAEKNDTKGLEEFARNMCKEKNIDFEKEIGNFQSQLQSFGINYKK